MHKTKLWYLVSACNFQVLLIFPLTLIEPSLSSEACYGGSVYHEVH